MPPYFMQETQKKIVDTQASMRMRLIYMWVKQDHISLREFEACIDFIHILEMRGI